MPFKNPKSFKLLSNPNNYVNAIKSQTTQAKEQNSTNMDKQWLLEITQNTSKSYLRQSKMTTHQCLIKFLNSELKWKKLSRATHVLLHLHSTGYSYVW